MEKFKYIAQLSSWLFVFMTLTTFVRKKWPDCIPDAFEDAVVIFFVGTMIFIWVDSVFDLGAWVWRLFK